MKICRVCMQGEDKDFIPIFSKLNDVHIADTISDSCSVQLVENDGLPGQICHTCVLDVKTVSAFVSKVRQSDCKLRQLRNYGPPPAGQSSSDFEVVVVKTESVDEPDGAEAVTGSGDEFVPDNDDGDYKSESEDSGKPLRQRRKRRKSEDAESNWERKGKKRGPGRKRKVKVESDNDSEEERGKDALDAKEQEMFDVIDLPEGSFVCCSCCKFYQTQEELEGHVEVHKRHAVKNPDCIHCGVCKRKFKKTAALKRHVGKVKVLTKLYECIQCKLRFMNGIGRRIHAQRHPKNIEEKMKQEYGEILCCVQNCSKSFTSDQLLIQHGQEAHRINKQAYELEDSTLKPVECPVCFKKFSSEHLLRRHRKRNSMPLNHQCATCGLKFRTKDVLSFHELNHAEQKPFPCDICQKHFASKNSLKVHQRSHSNDKPYICATCGARFYQKAQLITHEHTHSDGPLPFRCETCEKYFKTKNSLRNHMRQHTGEKPFPCRHCPMSFSNHTNRQRHEMNHTGNKPFKCSYCDKTFTIKRLQLEHECKHTGVKPFKCSFCSKSFIRKRFQLDHESTHTGEKPYRCEICGRTFSQRSPLRRHMETHRLAAAAAAEAESVAAAVSTTPVLSGIVSPTMSIGGGGEQPGPSGGYFQHPQNLSVSLQPSV